MTDHESLTSPVPEWVSGTRQAVILADVAFQGLQLVVSWTLECNITGDTCLTDDGRTLAEWAAPPPSVGA